MQQKTTNRPPPRTQKGAKTLSNPHQCPILLRGGGGWGFQLTGALVGREDTIHAKAESASKQHLKDNETAEEIRRKAMESLKETKKRNSDEGGASPKRRKSRRAEPLVDFLREKAAADREIRQQELRAKQQITWRKVSSK